MCLVDAISIRTVECVPCLDGAYVRLLLLLLVLHAFQTSDTERAAILVVEKLWFDVRIRDLEFPPFLNWVPRKFGPNVAGFRRRELEQRRA